MKPFTRIIILVFVLFVQQTLYAQDKLFTIEDASGMNEALRPKTLQNLQWRANSDLFAWIAANSLLSGNVMDEKRDTLLKLEVLNPLVINAGGDTLKRFPSVTWIEADKFMFITKNKLFVFDLITKEIKKVNDYDEKGENRDIDPTTFAVAFTRENNLFIALNGEEIRVTGDENKGIVNGLTVHRNEFGIYKGTFWSPKGNYLAFYRMDETMVTDYPLVDIESRPAEVKSTKYPMAGMTSHQVTVGVLNPQTNEKIFLKTGEPVDQYLTNITWSPDEKFIYIAVLNRDQNHLKLNRYNVVTGDLDKTLFEESDKEYVEPLHGLYFLQSNPGQFLWFSQRDGHNQLFLYDTDGNLIKQVTQGAWDVSELLGTDPKGQKVFYISNQENPVEQHIYSVDLNTSRSSRLSSVKGTHNAQLSSDGKYVIDTYSSLSSKISLEYALIDEKGKVKQILLQNSNPLKEYKLGETTIFTIKSKGGDDLYCRMIKPVDFDPAKKYPVIVYVYGGPHSQLVTDSWLGAAGLFLNYLAQQGFVVFTLDNRGTTNRGIDFEQATFRQLGVVEADDQMQGIIYLKTLSFVDSDRIGVTGWSYGGFMTINLMLRYPDVFRAGCCGGPVTDWKYYEVMYGERYMDTPLDNPKGYEETSLLNKAGNLKGKLLIIHGTIDPTVVWQNSLQFLKSCIDAGVQVDYFVYPGHEHGVGGKDRVHLNKKMAEYLIENLK
ncbi:MAG: DPP IV N-terminal domain-containing protein [Bacteroidetes bacterium]|nr:DPP IV N-terminal domain-containing protein [Bacteroidota bacterium]